MSKQAATSLFQTCLGPKGRLRSPGWEESTRRRGNSIDLPRFRAVLFERFMATGNDVRRQRDFSEKRKMRRPDSPSARKTR